MGSALTHRLQVLSAALLFSTGGAAIKLTTLSSWQVAGLRSGLAALALLLLMPTWRAWWRPRALWVGAPYAATMILFVVANKLTTAANAIFLQATAPLYLMLLGPVVLGERLRVADLVFAGMLAIGMLLFFVGVEPAWATAPDPVAGNLAGAASGVTWALTLLGLRWLGRDGASTESELAGPAVVAGNLLAFLFCLPFALPVPAAGAADWLVVAYLGLFQIGLAYVFMTRGLRSLPALEVSLLLLLEPVLNALLAWLVHGEQPGSWSLAGCAIILGATLARTVRGSSQLAGRPA
jgi:drug/metabolite transporter (DMT)-like permease